MSILFQGLVLVSTLFQGMVRGVLEKGGDNPAHCVARAAL